MVAVSKTKPSADIVDVYKTGIRHFGENYAQELIEKANSQLIQEQCPDIKWHMIGHLQSNKVNKVLRIPGLYMIQTIDSAHLATVINDSWGRICAEKPVAKQPTPPAAAAAVGKIPMITPPTPEEELMYETIPRSSWPRIAENRLRVLVQVNTSGETEKSGAPMSDVMLVILHIIKECPHLHFCGLMTIGKLGHDYATGPNGDFVRLMEVVKMCEDQLHYLPRDLHISMGMSHDYERAIEVGSTLVRVGTAIFGFRPQKLPEALKVGGSQQNL